MAGQTVADEGISVATDVATGTPVPAAAPGPVRGPAPAPGRGGTAGLLTRAEATSTAHDLIASVQTAVQGVGDTVPLAVTALLGGGHLLLEDVPGTGKTLLARSLARAVSGSFRRVQATPDLSAAEITGSGVWDPDAGRFAFLPGPVFAHVVLVDEINRTSPRTQSALMEAMDEGAVTVDGERHALPQPHFIIATQNPVEQHGTFPLPEGQLDRFMIVTSLGYVDAATERNLVREQLLSPPEASVTPVLDVAGWQSLRGHVAGTHVAEPVLDYAVGLSRSTREHPEVALGASARATVALVRCSQARALLAGRDFVSPEDVRTAAGPVLAHRLVLRDHRTPAGQRGRALGLIADLVARAPIPALP